MIKRLLIIPAVMLAFAALLVNCSGEREDVTKYAPTETFPEDTILNSVVDKKALIIIAHDDDMSGMTGTISKLNKEGWKIQVLSFPQTEERNKTHIEACEKILDSVLFFNVTQKEIRNDFETNEKQYQAVSKSRFPEIFNSELVKKELIGMVNEFKPSIIFTLDNEIGGYGHPEHVFISQMVLDLAQSARISPDYIFQNVWTDHMETTIMSRHSERMKSWGFEGDDWERAKKAYGVYGAPEPTLQIYIADEANEKMDYLMSYNERERKTMGFFIPAFQEYTAEEYFSIFDREFFRVIRTKQTSPR